MGDLKPIGSEKLQGIEKINRIIEISRYKENIPNNLNENAKSVYEIGLHDGNTYNIVKEKLGYVIKRQISESTSDYLEPMKNRKYYQSYSQALKRLNLLTKEVNRLNDVSEGQSLFSEQKKFVLKAPKPSADDSTDSEMVPPPPPAEPPAVPQPALPPSPETGDMGGETPVENETEVDVDVEEMGSEENVEEMPKTEDEGVSFKMIQKLTGKLSQKIREFENEKGLTSENIKYVINMILSSFDLTSLSEEDKEDILMKFEGEEDMGDEDVEGGFEDVEVGFEEELPAPEETQPTEEMGEAYGSILDSIFKESKVDKVISKYFNVSKEEKDFLKESLVEKKQRVKNIVNSKMKTVVTMTETFEQELASKKFLQENPNYNLVGKTNKKNLVFEHKTRQVKISPEGLVI